MHVYAFVDEVWWNSICRELRPPGKSFMLFPLVSWAVFGQVWQWRVRAGVSGSNPLWVLAIKGYTVCRGFNNNNITNWRFICFFWDYHLALATLSDMSDKIFIPLGQTTSHLSSLAWNWSGHQQEDIMEVRGSRLEETEHVEGKLTNSETNSRLVIIWSGEAFWVHDCYVGWIVSPPNSCMLISLSP